MRIKKHVSLASPDSDRHLLQRNLTLESEHQPFCTASHRGGFGEDIPRAAAGFGTDGRGAPAGNDGTWTIGEYVRNRRKSMMGGVLSARIVFFVFVVRG